MKTETAAAAEGSNSSVTDTLQAALNDVLEGLRRWELWGTMGWYDVRQHYRRSVLGPFWLTLSMAVMVGALGFLYGGLFGHSMRDYLPYLALGLIFWAFMASFMTRRLHRVHGGSPFHPSGECAPQHLRLSPAVEEPDHPRAQRAGLSWLSPSSLAFGLEPRAFSSCPALMVVCLDWPLDQRPAWACSPPASGTFRLS